MALSRTGLQLVLQTASKSLPAARKNRINKYLSTTTWIKCHHSHLTLTLISYFQGNQISLILLKGHFAPRGLQLYGGINDLIMLAVSLLAWKSFVIFFYCFNEFCLRLNHMGMGRIIQMFL